MKQNNKPVIYWILQENQVTPNLIDFFELTQHRLKDLLILKFLVPETDKKTFKMTGKLKPVMFKIGSRTKHNSYEGYCRKRDQLGAASFSDGLKFWQVLLLDDLGSGNLYQALVNSPDKSKVAGIIIQIPTPLGSGESEERIFYAWTYLAKMNKVPVIGYELLPLTTRWTLAPSLMDGIIATRRESHTYLSCPQAHLDNKIWMIPRYEGKFFSPVTHHMWRNGMGRRYEFNSANKIAPQKTFLYISHNVAMSYEYKDLIRMLIPVARDLHLMFCVGKDQVRGSHSHEQIIQIVCREELKNFSYSFHDQNHPSDIVMADALISCSDCYAAEVSSIIGVPTFIYDPMIPPGKEGYKTWTNDRAEFRSYMEKVISDHARETELAYTIIEIAKGRIRSQQVEMPRSAK